MLHVVRFLGRMGMADWALIDTTYEADEKLEYFDLCVQYGSLSWHWYNKQNSKSAGQDCTNGYDTAGPGERMAKHVTQYTRLD